MASRGPGQPDSTTLESRLNILDTLGVKLVRFTIVWREIAPTEPADPTNPKDPAYDWHAFDPVMNGLRAHHITALSSIWGSPCVRLWTAWNEANLRLFAAPVSPSLYVSHVLNPAWAALHRANRANRVAGGVTSPRRTPSGMSPITFAEGMRRAHARLDAYAANQFPGHRNETPFHDPCRNCQTLSMASRSRRSRAAARGRCSGARSGPEGTPISGPRACRSNTRT